MIRHERYLSGTLVETVEVFRDGNGDARFRRIEDDAVVEERAATEHEATQLEADERVQAQVPLGRLDDELRALKSRSAEIEAQLDIVPEWKAGEAVQVGDRRSYDGVVYECIKGHTTKDSRKPPDDTSVWSPEA